MAPRIPQRLAFALATVLVAGLAVWALWADGDPRETDAPEPAARPTESMADPEPLAAPAAEPPPTPIATSAFRAPVELTPDEEPLTPVHGELLERSRSTVAIAVRDAHGNDLESVGFGHRVHRRLWRRLGPWWLHADVDWDQARTRLTAGPGRRQALEPGEWVALTSIGSYGIGELTFHVGRHATREEELRTPGFARVVTLRFVDPRGRPVPWLPRPPEFRCAHSGSIPWREAAPAVLRAPPSFATDCVTFGRGGVGGSFSSRSRRRARRWPTDEGRFAVRVVAGVGGTVRLDDAKRFFEEKTVEVSSDFTGPEWEDREVVVTPRADYAAITEALQKAGAGDPGGFLSARQAPQRGQAPAWPRWRRSDARDPATLPGNRARVLLTLQAPPDFEPVVSGATNGEQPSSAGEDLWVLETKPGDPLPVGVTDGLLFRELHEPLPLPARGQMVERTLAAAPRPCRISVRTAPTIAAWARSVTLALTRGDDRPDPVKGLCRKIRPARREGLTHVVESGLAPGLAAALSERARLVIRYAGDATRGLGFDAYGKPEPGYGDLLQLSVPLDPTERRRLLDGDLALDLRELLPRSRSPGLIAFRAVGDLDEGLPWVEGSIVPWREDALARRLRDLATARDRDGRRPQRMHIHAASRRITDPESAAGLENGEVEVEIEEEVIELCTPTEPLPSPGDAVLLEAAARTGLAEDYDLPALRRLWDEGAWYDTHRRLRTDDDGYVVSPAARLVPGETYVLYLWSRSRDDLRPDARVVFRAEETITDLGVLRLPGY